MSNENHIIIESEDGCIYLWAGLTLAHFTVEEAESLISDLKIEVKALKGKG